MVKLETEGASEPCSRQPPLQMAYLEPTTQAMIICADERQLSRFRMVRRRCARGGLCSKKAWA